MHNTHRQTQRYADYLHQRSLFVQEKTDIRKTQMGCMELKMALETGVVLLMPSR